MTWATSSSRSCSASPVGVVAAEADPLAAEPLGDDLVEADERPAADEQDVGRVDPQILLLGVLPPPCGRDVGDGAFQELQEGLLDPFARDVAGDRDVLAGLADLVDLVDVDDPALGGGDVVVGGHDELEDQVLDVLADVAGLGQRGGVADGERDVQAAGQGLRQGRLAAAGGADQEDVALGDLDVREVGVVDLAAQDALVVVDHGDGEGLLDPVLADDVLVQVGDQFARGWGASPGGSCFRRAGRRSRRRPRRSGADVGDSGRWPAATRALPSIIGPASAAVRPQKSQRIGGEPPRSSRLRSLPSRSSLQVGFGERGDMHRSGTARVADEPGLPVMPLRIERTETLHQCEPHVQPSKARIGVPVLRAKGRSNGSRISVSAGRPRAS